MGVRTVGLCPSSSIPGELAVEWVDQGMVVVEAAGGIGDGNGFGPGGMGPGSGSGFGVVIHVIIMISMNLLCCFGCRISVWICSRPFVPSSYFPLHILWTVVPGLLELSPQVELWHFLAMASLAVSAEPWRYPFWPTHHCFPVVMAVPYSLIFRLLLQIRNPGSQPVGTE